MGSNSGCDGVHRSATSPARSTTHARLVETIRLIAEETISPEVGSTDTGSMLEVSSLDADRPWVVDLAGDTPATTEIEVCGTVDVIGTLSPDGSILACCWEEDDGRSYRLLGLRSGENVMLDATSAPRMVSIVPD